MSEPTALAKSDEYRVRSGRPKGSRNKITLIKLMAEEAVRDKNLDRMLKVCDDIIEDALDGNFACRKLVWQAIMSKSGVDPSTSSEATPTILIRTDAPLQLVAKDTTNFTDAIEGEVVEELLLPPVSPSAETPPSS